MSRPRRIVYVDPAPHVSISADPNGFAITCRHGERGLTALVGRFGRAVWDGGDGAPELNRAGADPRRPWM